MANNTDDESWLMILVSTMNVMKDDLVDPEKMVNLIKTIKGRNSTLSTLPHFQIFFTNIFLPMIFPVHKGDNHIPP